MVFLGGATCSSLDAGPMVDRDTQRPLGPKKPGGPLDPLDLLTHSSCSELERE